MYDKSYADYTELAERFLFRYADRLLHDRVIRALELEGTDELLEIGCNRGVFLARLRGLCARVVGVDRNPCTVGADPRLDLRCMSATALELPDASFDKIVSLHTLEHVADLPRAFAEIERVLRPNGRAVIAYPLELVRGFSTLPSAIASHHDPLMARRMHVHKLMPYKIADLVEGTRLTLSSSRLSFLPIPITPVYVSVLVKTAA
jgi:SAM-dependent methyltransferase